jgi:hypothetical protein
MREVGYRGVSAVGRLGTRWIDVEVTPLAAGSGQLLACFP